MEDADAIASDVSALHERLTLAHPHNGVLEDGLRELCEAVQRLMVLQAGAMGGAER